MIRSLTGHNLRHVSRVHDEIIRSVVSVRHLSISCKQNIQVRRTLYIGSQASRCGIGGVIAQNTFDIRSVTVCGILVSIQFQCKVNQQFAVHLALQPRDVIVHLIGKLHVLSDFPYCSFVLSPCLISLSVNTSLAGCGCPIGAGGFLVPVNGR